MKETITTYFCEYCNHVLQDDCFPPGILYITKSSYGIAEVLSGRQFVIPIQGVFCSADCLRSYMVKEAQAIDAKSRVGSSN